MNIDDLIFNYFPIVLVIILLVGFGFFYKHLYYPGNDEPKSLNNSMIAIKLAWILFACVIIFYIIYGIIYPFHPSMRGPLADTRPQLFLFDWIPKISAVFFAYFAFMGTSFIQNKIKNFFIATMIRIILTALHCVIAYSFFLVLLLATCSFHAGDCCC